MWLPYKIFFVSLHVLALPFHIIIILSLVVYKGLVLFLAKITQDFVGPTPGPCAIFLPDAIWSRPHSSIVVATELNGPMSWEEAVNLFQEIYDLKDKNGQTCYKELGYYLVQYLGYGFWKEVPNFKIGDRIHLHSNTEENNSPPKSSTSHQDEFVPSMVEGKLREAYKEDQPLWDVYLLPSYNGNPNGTLVILRFHHLMADGMSFVKLFYALTGSYKLPDTFIKPVKSVQGWNRMTNSILLKIGTAIHTSTDGFIDYINEVIIKKDKNSLHYDENGKIKLTGNWICSMVTKVDLGELKTSSRNLGCSISHIILTAFTNAMERYFYKYHGKEPIPEGFNYFFPLPIPNHPDLRLVNHWCIAKMFAKFGIASTFDQLEYFKEETKHCAFAPLTIVSAFMVKVMSGLFPVAVMELFGPKTVNTVTLSNVVGPQDNRRMGDTCISDLLFWMPIALEETALSAGVISCNGGMRICLTADKGSIPDRSRLDDLGMMIYEEIRSICEIKKFVPTIATANGWL